MGDQGVEGRPECGGHRSGRGKPYSVDHPDRAQTDHGIAQQPLARRLDSAWLERLFAKRQTEVPGEFKHRGTGYPGQHTLGRRRGYERAVLDQKKIGGRRLGDTPLRIEQERFVGPGPLSRAAGQNPSR